MRILASIFFISILLFNSGGYRLLLDYVEVHQNTQLEMQLDDKQYDEASLIEIRVPVSLPYQTDWKEFERVDGEVEFNGMHYKFVERKLQGGEMIYKCLPNEGKAQLVNARENFFKLVNDLQTQEPSSKKSNSKHSVKTFSFDFCDEMKCWTLDALQQENSSYNNYSAAVHSAAYMLTPEQPPEA
jgi:predicted HNH restriction endonuclease